MHRLTKLNTCETPLVGSAQNHDEYRSSVISSLFRISSDHLSPNIGYSVEGNLIGGPLIGESLMMDRYFRNGQEIRGTFATSRVTGYDEETGILTTKNSIYKLEKV